MRRLKLRTRLYLISGLLFILALASGILGLGGIRRTNFALEAVYKNRVVPLKDLKVIADAYAVAIIDAVNKANAGLFDADAARKSLQSARLTIRDQWQVYLTAAHTEEENNLIAEATKLFGPADAAVDEVLRHLSDKNGSLTGSLSEFDGPLYARIDPISEKITQLIDLQLHLAAQEYAAANTRYDLLLKLTLGLLLCAVLIGIYSVAFTREIVSTTQKLSEELTQGSAFTASAAAQIASSSQILADGSSSQASSLEETSASLEELASMTKRNADSTRTARETASRARVSADQGVRQMQAMQAAMHAINDASQDITKILKTIDEIAFQTNILALNAAVEAARAGEAGAGFAVVADEVRALAQRSAQAAQETAAKIASSVARSSDGVALSDEVSRSLTAIQTQIQQLSSLVSDIATATDEQNQGVNQINVALAQMDKVTQANASVAEESAAASQELNTQAGLLNTTVTRLSHLVAGQPRAPRPARKSTDSALPRLQTT